MTDARKFYVVKHTFTVIHEGKPWNADAAHDDLGSWHFAENHCSENVINALADRQIEGFCVTCCGHEGEFVERYDTLEEAQAAHPEALELEAK